jgi:hypothetical protein
MARLAVALGAQAEGLGAQDSGPLAGHYGRPT